MKTMSKIALAGVMTLLLSSCSSQGTIANLEEDAINAEESTLQFDNLDHEQVRTEYEELIDLVDDEYLKEQIQRRIAGVNMQEAGDKQTRLAPKQGYYRNAITSYVDILEKYPNSPDNAEVLYQLAKAYDMEGDTNNARLMLERLVRRHPDYAANPEANFRLGDIYYSRSWYAKAENAYRKTSRQQDGKLVLNAHYMMAWAQYKQGKYNQSLDNLSIVLNDLLTAEISGRKLSSIESHLVKDTMHSMSLALVNLGGAKAIEDVRGLQGKRYAWRVYEELAGFYLEKARYDDSAVSYREYILLNPLDSRSAEFHSKLIDAYITGAFPSLVLSEKENYTEFYGPKSKYLKQNPSQAQQVYSKLAVYYVELAEHFHAQGQQALKKSQRTGEKHLNELANKSLAKATGYYGRYIETFKHNKAVADFMYKKADAHFELGQYKQAALDYSVVAYGNEQYKKGDDELSNKAGYANLIAHTKYIDKLKADKKDKARIDLWQAHSVDAMLKFANVFHKDMRATSVLTNAAQALFALNEYDRAIVVATELITKTKNLNNELKQTAYGILAHSYFQKSEFQLAQNNYQAQRKLVDIKSASYKEISHQIAASVYKKADQIKTQGDHKQAIKEMLSIKTLAPNTTIRVLAQYDAVSLMLLGKQWDAAITELNQLNKQFPKHKLALEFPRKLAFAYEQKQDWQKAASAYLSLYQKDPDPQVKQEALFIMAGLQQRIENTDKAIEYYRDYAHKYEQPFDNRMEARFHLAELYLKKKDNTRHLFWLRRVIDGDKKSGSNRTERSRYLGAWANTKYGDYFSWEFNRRKLTMPIESSMQRKNKYLQDATARYEMAADYGILEFVTQANFKMAELYRKFGHELGNPPIPKGMSSEDSGMYSQLMKQQAQPFTDLARSIHENNVQLSWQGYFNKWISNSFESMQILSPVRFGKVEEVARYGDEIR